MKSQEILSALPRNRRAITTTSEKALPADERAFLDANGIRYIEHADGGYTVIFTDADAKDAKYAHLDFLKAAGRSNEHRVVRIVTPTDAGPKPRRRRGTR